MQQSITVANMPDNRIYTSLSSPAHSSSPVFYLPSALHMVVSPGYDNNVYEYSKKVLGISLVSLVERYESNSKKRLEIVCFYQSDIGQTIYDRRRISMESVIEHIKSVFGIDVLPTRRFHTVSATVFLSVLFYQLIVYSNCKL